MLTQGAVSGVLLVTPNNIMFDPHRMDPLVQAHGCEEYGIMCPLEEVQSVAVCKEITDPKIREAVPEYENVVVQYVQKYMVAVLCKHVTKLKTFSIRRNTLHF